MLTQRRVRLLLRLEAPHLRHLRLRLRALSDKTRRTPWSPKWMTLAPKARVRGR